MGELVEISRLRAIERLSAGSLDKVLAFADGKTLSRGKHQVHVDVVRTGERSADIKVYIPGSQQTATYGIVAESATAFIDQIGSKVNSFLY